jgi:cytochrome b6-f complex iron-sulfur subunit
MSTTLAVVVVVVGAALAVAVVAASMRRRDADRATGSLSRETVTRDRKAETSHIAGELDPRVAGKEAEQVAVQRWRGPSKEVVSVGGRDITPYVPPDPETIGVTRRQFLNRSIVVFMGFSLAAFGGAVLAFLWPLPKAGFGSKIKVGKIPDIKAAIEDAKGALYLPEGKMWVVEYPVSALEKAKKVYSPAELKGMENGLLALFQKCPHLGCRVPFCLSSQWFECPCHGSRYNRDGEKKGGPAPRGMDRFAMEVAGQEFIVNTGVVIPGPPIGTNTTGQEQEGPSCLGASLSH